MAEEYISGEEHRARRAGHKGSRSGGSNKSAMLAVAGIVLLGVGFFGGMAYQKDHGTKATATTAPGTTGQGRGFGGAGTGGRFSGARPTFGQVTAISDTSITVAGQNSINTTLAITSSTTITNSGQTVAASTITVGETVAVIASTSDSTQAARILVNPSFGGGGGGAAPSGSTPD